LEQRNSISHLDDTLDDALRLTGKREAKDRFIELVKITGDRQPKLLTWLAKRPLAALKIAKDCQNFYLLLTGFSGITGLEFI
jgi:hypothetical protein